jgi:hypothetical protein
MSDPVQVVPFLTACVDDGEFTLRVDDSPLAKAVAPVLLQAIGRSEGARKLTLVTPSDLKVYKFNGRPVPQPQPAPVQEEPPRVTLSQDRNAPPAPEIAEYDQSMAEAAGIARLMAQQNSEVVAFPDGQAGVKKPARKESPAPSSACGRCRGQGTLEGGGSCPVCQGRGMITRFGRQRR